jgi:hypothetical protein
MGHDDIMDKEKAREVNKRPEEKKKKNKERDEERCAQANATKAKEEKTRPHHQYPPFFSKTKVAWKRSWRSKTKMG